MSAVLAAMCLSSYPPLAHLHIHPHILATNLSAVDHPCSHITFAAATSHSALVFAISPTNSPISGLCGEIYTLIVGSLLPLQSPVVLSPDHPPLYTGHFSSVPFI